LIGMLLKDVVKTKGKWVVCTEVELRLLTGAEMRARHVINT
jgi:hypothetical protein